ncbi:FCD domain-containing protein, partial [Escherichia coli]|uniref:FCD domain-containing protein n=1 Tax=Escherichia coli TaxID=562 RepID=UPI001655895C
FGIYRGAESPALLQIIENLWQQSGPYLSSIERAMTASPAKRRHDFGAAQHDRIIAALESGDGDTARATLVED